MKKLKQLVSHVLKPLRRHKKILFMTLVFMGGIAAAGLAFLGTGNVWLTVLAGLAGLVGTRIWWICERWSRAERTMTGILGSSGRLADSVNALSLEVADLTIQVQSLSDTD